MREFVPIIEAFPRLFCVLGEDMHFLRIDGVHALVTAVEVPMLIFIHHDIVAESFDGVHGRLPSFHSVQRIVVPGDDVVFAVGVNFIHKISDDFITGFRFKWHVPVRYVIVRLGKVFLAVSCGV